MKANAMTYAELIEIVAKAIYCNRNGQGAKPWSILTKSHKVPYQSDAAAALSAIRSSGLAITPREATGEMCVAGGDAQSQSIGSWGEPKICYPAMVEAGEVKP